MSKVRTIPIRLVTISCCWPFSGKKYQVMEGGKCILETNNLEKANAKAGDSR